MRLLFLFVFYCREYEFESSDSKTPFHNMIMRVRDTEAVFSAEAFLRAAGVCHNVAVRIAPALEDDPNIPDACKEAIRHLLLRFPPSLVFHSTRLSRWEDILDDRESILNTACESVALLEALDGVRDIPDIWIPCRFERDSPQGPSFYKRYEQEEDNGDKIPGVDVLLKAIGRDVVPSRWLYHGTTLHSALNILRDGIDLRVGRSDQDFTINPAFYLNEDYADAKRWAARKAIDAFTTEAAVIAFQVPTNDIKAIPRLDLLDLSQDPNLWARLVLCCRQHATQRLRDRLLDRQSLLDESKMPEAAWIRGVICANPTKVRLGEEVPRSRGDGFTQVAVCDQTVAETLTRLAPLLLCFTVNISSQSPR